MYRFKGKEYSNIEDIPMRDRIYYLFYGGWKFGGMLGAARAQDFGFSYSEEFKQLAKEVYTEVLLIKKIESAKSSFEHMERLYKEDPEGRRHQYETAAMELEIWEEVNLKLSEKTTAIKAKKWDNLSDQIGKCYGKYDDNDNEQSSEFEEEHGEQADLITIGEIAASAFGYM